MPVTPNIFDATLISHAISFPCSILSNLWKTWPTLVHLAVSPPMIAMLFEDSATTAKSWLSNKNLSVIKGETVQPRYVDGMLCQDCGFNALVFIFKSRIEMGTFKRDTETLTLPKHLKAPTSLLSVPHMREAGTLVSLHVLRSPSHDGHKSMQSLFKDAHQVYLPQSDVSDGTFDTFVSTWESSMATVGTLCIAFALWLRMHSVSSRRRNCIA